MAIIADSDGDSDIYFMDLTEFEWKMIDNESIVDIHWLIGDRLVTITEPSTDRLVTITEPSIDRLVTMNRAFHASFSLSSALPRTTILTIDTLPIVPPSHKTLKNLKKTKKHDQRDKKQVGL